MCLNTNQWKISDFPHVSVFSFQDVTEEELAEEQAKQEDQILK